MQMLAQHASIRCLHDNIIMTAIRVSQKENKPNPWPSQFLFYQELSNIRLRRPAGSYLSIHLQPMMCQRLRTSQDP
jgi:hypothetical protein